MAQLLCRPDGVNIQLVVENRVPYLVEICFVAGPVEAVAQAPAHIVPVAAELSADDKLRLVAKSVKHQMTHFPKNPF